MKFSVVIPLYNKAGYIRQTVMSVLGQTLDDYEIIVVDDGSGDGGAQEVADLQDTRIRLVFQANGGVSAARNHGIALASGEWIAFLDADDWWHPEYLAVQARTIADAGNADMVATGLMAIPDAPGWNPERWPVPGGGAAREDIPDLPHRWMRGHPFFTGSVAVRASVLKAMQPCFVVGETDGEDLDLWLRISEKSPVRWCPTPLVAYRDAVAGSLSTTHRHEGLPPFLTRLQARARSGQLAGARARSALEFVAQQQVSTARKGIVAGRRWFALRTLVASAPAGFRLKRWWVSVAMVLAAPAWVVQRWHRHVKHRAGVARKSLLQGSSGPANH